MKQYLAIDLGATSGRAIVGTVSDGGIRLDELTRFPNNIVERAGHYYWDIDKLYEEILRALRECASQNIEIESIGIDTWGVDVGFLNACGELISQPFSYRDPRTEGVPEQFFTRIPREQVYEWTGTQVMNFNTLYQLAVSDVSDARHILFLPDLLSYRLTGKMVTERTILSTSQLYNPRTDTIQPELLAAVGVTADMFAPIVEPSTQIGTLTPEVQRQTGCGAIPVIAVAGHDTASAIAAVPAQSENFAYLSSGTWSLMGIEAPQPIINAESQRLNFTNEGGVFHTTRFLKNICGMWIIESLRREWKEAGQDISHSTLINEAAQLPASQHTINPDSPLFANPASMQEAIKAAIGYTPATPAEYAHIVYDSLAARYAEVFAMLQTFAPHPIEVLHVIGGGSQNTFLNQLTANACGVPVVAGPVEATALGNVMLQWQRGRTTSLQEMRKIISNSIKLQTFRSH